MTTCISHTAKKLTKQWRNLSKNSNFIIKIAKREKSHYSIIANLAKPNPIKNRLDS